jgi:hypothetical protein
LLRAAGGVFRHEVDPIGDSGARSASVSAPIGGFVLAIGGGWRCAQVYCCD